MLELVDTHCHVHSARSGRDDYTAKKWHEAGIQNPDELIESAKNAGVSRLICVGTDMSDSVDAVTFVQNRQNCWASVGLHPHDAKESSSNDLRQIRKMIEEDEAKKKEKRKIVAIGECGLDYYYEHSPKKAQREMLESQLELAIKYKLPVIFHVREAFDDFWPIFDNFPGLNGILHSFTANIEEINRGLERGLHFGLNGIMTFTKDESQLAVARHIPLDHLVLETDAPYLTPKPFRGKICKPEHIVLTAEFLSDLREEKVEDLVRQTTINACKIFSIK